MLAANDAVAGGAVTTPITTAAVSIVAAARASSQRQAIGGRILRADRIGRGYGRRRIEIVVLVVVAIDLFVGVQGEASAQSQDTYPLDVPVATTPPAPVGAVGPAPLPIPTPIPPTFGVPAPTAGRAIPSSDGLTPAPPAASSVPGEAVVGPGGRSGRLELRPPAVRPGETAVAVGSGCESLSAVTVRVDGQVVTSTAADAQGRFETAVSLPPRRPGRHAVVAECGTLRLDGVLDAVVPVTSGTPLAQLAAAAAVLTFFVLLVGLLLGSRESRARGTARRW